MGQGYFVPRSPEAKDYVPGTAGAPVGCSSFNVGVGGGSLGGGGVRSDTQEPPMGPAFGRFRIKVLHSAWEQVLGSLRELRPITPAPIFGFAMAQPVSRHRPGPAMKRFPSKG